MLICTTLVIPVGKKMRIGRSKGSHVLACGVAICDQETFMSVCNYLIF